MKKILMFLCVVCFVVSSACLFSCQNKIDTELFYVDMGTPFPIQGLVEYYGVKEYGSCLYPNTVTNTIYSQKSLVVPGKYQGEPLFYVYLYGKGEAPLSCQKVEFQEGIQFINGAFDESLTEVSLPNSLLHVDEEVFEKAVNLKYTVKNGVKYLGNKKNPYVYAAGLADETITDVVLEEGCRVIGNFGPSALTSVTLPDDMAVVSYRAFAKCQNLTTVNLGAKTEVVVDSAFNGCTSLTEINGFSQLKTIGDYAFANCESLSNVPLENVQEVGGFAFYNCKALTEIVVPETVKEMGGGAFQGCSSLQKVQFFMRASKLPSGIFAQTAIKEITYSDTITKIGSNAFQECENLTYLPLQGIEEIERGAFSYCTGLTSFEIPLSVTRIEEEVFKGCTTLTEVEIPHSVTILGTKIFADCTSLHTVHFNATVKALPVEIFANTPIKELFFGNAVINIGATGLKEYSATLEAVKLSDAMTTLPEYLFLGFSNLKEVQLPEKLVEISKGCFMNCTALTEINLPDTVKEIGDAAFFGCSSLTSIKIPASVTHISARAFYECEELCSIVMSEGIQSIGAEAFGRCVNLTKIVLPASVTELSYRVFIGCEGLTVYCKAADEGANWHPDWNVNNVPVEFGCTDSIIEMNPVGQE